MWAGGWVGRSAGVDQCPNDPPPTPSPGTTHQPQASPLPAYRPQAWRNTQRKESAITQMTTDPHSPDPIRINVPLSNMPEFYAAFGVKPGNKLYRAPEDQVQVW